MWTKLSLRARLFLPLGVMFVAGLLFGSVALYFFAPAQLAEENEPESRAAGKVAAALNGALETSPDPKAMLDAFVRALGTSEAIRFRPVEGIQSPVPVRASPGPVPGWFVGLLKTEDIGAAFPIMIKGERAGDILYAPDISADIFEKWVSFLGVTLAGTIMMLLTALIATIAAGGALTPLRNLGDGLTRMRMGNYEHLIPVSGPPEIRHSSEEANALAQTLGRLSHDNRGLLRRIVSLQDDERRDVARELHDELGPLLFGIRANTIAMMETVPAGHAALTAAAENILGSVEALQQANRRILDRLRPLYIQELGLSKSIRTLLQSVRAQAPDLKVTAEISAALDSSDGPLSLTVYRMIQEGVTNVLRHANASATDIKAAVAGGQLVVEISDDGIGFPADERFGRGLTGMQERVRALSGTLELTREHGRTTIRCRLPVAENLESEATGREA